MKEIFSLQERVNRLFDDVFSEKPERGTGGISWSPRVDIYELPDTFVVHAEVPGVTEKDLEITIEGRIMSIRGHRPSPSSLQKGCISRFYIMENSHGNFRRDFSLPNEIDKESITATLNDGLLEIRLPKKTCRESKRIPISEP